MPAAKIDFFCEPYDTTMDARHWFFGDANMLALLIAHCGPAELITLANVSRSLKAAVKKQYIGALVEPYKHTRAAITMNGFLVRRSSTLHGRFVGTIRHLPYFMVYTYDCLYWCGRLHGRCTIRNNYGLEFIVLNFFGGNPIEDEPKLTIVTCSRCRNQMFAAFIVRRGICFLCC